MSHPAAENRSKKVTGAGVDPSASIDRCATPPLRVLVCSGLDPSGGAGIAADIASITTQGGHCLPLISCQTVQNGRHFSGLVASEILMIEQQFASIAQTLKPHAIKLGLQPDPALVKSLMPLLAGLEGVPLFCDPVLWAGYCQSPMSDVDMSEVLRRYVIGKCFLLTPNLKELRKLSNSDDVNIGARKLLSMGCKNVLVTSAQTEGDNLVHQLYSADNNGECRCFRTSARPYNFHGSGCVLSASIALQYARHNDIACAISAALEFVDGTIDKAWPAYADVHFLRWQDEQ